MSAGWLKAGLWVVPLVGALVIWLGHTKLQSHRRWLTVTLFILTALLAIGEFALSRTYACMLASGKSNCLFDGFATLSVALLALLLARATARRRIPERGDCVLLLLICGAWAGVGAADNLLQLLVFLNLFLFVTYRWLHTKGIKWAFLYVPDQSDDDRK